MAVELKWETLFLNVADGTTASDAGAELRNEAENDMFIRRINEAHELTGADVNEGANVELSKAPTLQMSTNNSPFFSLPARVSQSGGTISANNGRQAYNARTGYAKGEIVLEQNESLFVNVAKTSGGAINAGYAIGYHF